VYTSQQPRYWVGTTLCASWLLSLVLGSCSAAPTSVPRTATALRADGTPEALLRLNEQARAGAVIETVGGQRVADAYRSLERDDAQTQTWLRAQTERTEHELGQLREPRAEVRLAQLLSIGSLGELAIGGSRVFFMAREAPRERPALYMLDDAAAESGSGLPEPPLVDPEDYGQRAALDYMAPSHDGRYIAFGISENGDERATLRVYDVNRRDILNEKIDHAKWSAIEWLHDDSGFYYRRYPRQGEPDWDEHQPDSYHARLYVHQLGQDIASDALVFAGEQPVDFPAAAVDDADRYVVINNKHSWTASDVWLWDRGQVKTARTATPAANVLAAVVKGEDRLSQGSALHGQLYLTTNLDAPMKRVIKVDLEHATDRTQWHTVVPESSATIEDTLLTRDYIVVHRIEDVRSHLEVYTPTGEARGEVELPGRGSLHTLASSPDHNRIVFVWSSFLVEPTLFEYDLAARKLKTLYQVHHDFRAEDYELLQAVVSSQDGTPVNVDYVQRRGTPKNGQNPVVLTGYGGFDQALLPAFSRSALYFLEQGGIYAQANLRGGGEYGEAWHRAGMLDQKQHVFEDFEAVVRWFSSSGISNPGRIAITGSSNGGLLIGGMITRAPATFAAAATYVGLYDMLRYPKFPPAALWTSEYGDPNDPRMAAYLLSYSPYHNVHEHTAYPAVLIETADHDTRVFWGHSAKFAAALQTANGGDKPIYFYLEHAVGHGRGTGISDLVRRYARQYAFLRRELNMPLVTSVH
jgi:prolyl oligopeptidase